MVHNSNIKLEIILELVKAKSHVRELARIINEPHVNVFRSLKNLMNEKVVDYKEEGRNKVYFIKNTLEAQNYVFMAEKYKFNKLLQKYPSIRLVLSEILKKTKNNVIIVFGSYAKFNAKEDSDIDVYIGSENLKLKKYLQHLNSKLSIKLGKFDVDSLLIKEIIKNHVILKGVEEFYEKSKFFETTET